MDIGPPPTLGIFSECMKKQPKHISIGNWNVKSCLLAKLCCLGSLECETFQGSCLRQALAKACEYKQWVRKFVMGCAWCFNEIWTSWYAKVCNLAEKDKHEPVIINTSSLHLQTILLKAFLWPLYHYYMCTDTWRDILVSKGSTQI
jgi:hypothetical protein